MKTAVLLVSMILFGIVAVGQKCGPSGKENERKNITADDLSKAPYNGIVNIYVKRIYNCSYNLSTASFIINDSLLITANHTVVREPFIRKIRLTGNGKTITLKRKDFKIYQYHKCFIHKKNDKKDIAVIALKKDARDSLGDYSIFRLFEFDRIADQETLLHLTGFPSDRPGILVDKQEYCKNLLTDSARKIVGYDLYTCKGDSGAPLWFEDRGKYNIAAIHHGRGGVREFDSETTNWGVKITSDVISWINDIINN